MIGALGDKEAGKDPLVGVTAGEEVAAGESSSSRSWRTRFPMILMAATFSLFRSQS